MTTDCVTLLPSTADALSELGIGDFYRVESVERMAWVVRILRELPDREDRFPHGKWATIQSIEHQLDEAAKVAAAKLDVPNSQVEAERAAKEEAAP